MADLGKKPRFLGEKGPFVAIALLFLTSLVATLFDSWKQLVQASMSPVFADLRMVTSAATCLVEDPSWNIDSDSCDPFGRSYNYPTILSRIFAHFGLGYEFSEEIGVALLLAFCLALTVALLVANAGNWSALTLAVWLAFLFSPAVLLLLERGNSDIVIFFLVVMATMLAVFNRWGARVVAAVLLVFAAQIKLIPIASSIGLLGRRPAQKILGIATVLLSGVLLFMNEDEWLRVAERSASPMLLGFGAEVIPRFVAHLLSLKADEWFLRGLGLVAFILLTVLITRLLSSKPSTPGSNFQTLLRNLLHGLLIDERARMLFLFGSAPLVFVFLIGASWDYRLSFLALPILAVARLHALGFTSSPAPAILLTIPTWLSFNSSPIYQLFGDLVIFFIFSVFAAIQLRILYWQFFSRIDQ